MNDTVQTRNIHTSLSSQNCDRQVSTSIERLKEEIRQMRIRRSNRQESDKMQKEQQKQQIERSFTSDEKEKMFNQRDCTGSKSKILVLESELRVSKYQLLGLTLQLKRQTRDMRNLRKENKELKQHLMECMSLLTKVANNNKNSSMHHHDVWKERKSTKEEKQREMNVQKHAPAASMTLKTKEQAPAAVCTITTLLEELDGATLKQVEGNSSSSYSAASDVATQGSQSSFSKKQDHTNETKVVQKTEQKIDCSESQQKSQSNEVLCTLVHDGIIERSDEDPFNLLHPKCVASKTVNATAMSAKQAQEKERIISNLLLKNDIEYSTKDITKVPSLLPDLSKSFQDLSSGSLLLFESSLEWST